MAEVRRTLVKSGPELWAEISDASALARRLAAFGAVRIIRAEAETLVDWEGERATGNVRLEPSGFGTRVTMTAAPVSAPTAIGADLEPELAAAAERPAPEAAADAHEPAADAHEPAADAHEPAPGGPGGPERRGTPPVHLESSPEPAPAGRRSFWARLFARRRRVAAPAPSRAPEAAAPAVDALAPPELAPLAAGLPATEAPAPEAPAPEKAAPEAAGLGTAPLAEEQVAAVLADALEALGTAHHRPFSRA